MARRVTLCAVTVIGTMATVCFLIGFIAPWWIVMRLSDVSYIPSLDLLITQPVRQRMGLLDGDDIMNEPMDEGNVIAHVDMKRRQEMAMEKEWMNPEMGDPMRHGMHGEPMPGNQMSGWSGSSDSDSSRSHNGPDRHQGQPIDQGGLWPTPSEGSMEEWVRNGFGLLEAMNDNEQRIHLHVSYGLWYSVYCAHVQDVTPYMSTEERLSEKRGKYSCLKLRTDHALNYGYFFDGRLWMNEYDIMHHRLSKTNMGGASLKEHQIESTMGVLFSLIGLISGIVGFGKAKKCLQLLCALAMLLAITLFLIPSIRLVKLSHQNHDMDSVHTRIPYSAVASLIGCVLAFVTLLIALVSVVRKHGVEAPEKWKKIHNEFIPDLSSDLKKPALAFLNDPLSEKHGLYDICNFSDVKPAEEYEPEEKPIA